MHSNIMGIMGETEAEQTLTQQHNLLQRLTQWTAIESQALLTTYIQEQVAQAIGISASQLDIQQPLNYMGIDSLIAMKLRNRFRTDLEIDVSAIKFMEDASIASLAIELSPSLINAQGSFTASVSQSQIPSQDEQIATVMDGNDDWLKGEI
ncbi:MAG: acyl carrier protein [Nostoc sp.]|uniref:acyl carrier protein n=1 Tax=Nostoc sp. TaxID=1180 RepID=UPI002FF78C92